MSDAKFVAPPSGHPNEFIMRMVGFLGSEFADSVNAFLASNAPRVTVVDEGEEHSLESYAVFKEYLNMVEGKMEAFMTSEGMTEDVFHAKCAECVEDDPAVNSYVSALVASWEFERFLALVRDFVADEAAMDVLQDVLGSGDDEDDAEGGGEGARGGGEDEDFSAFM